MIFQLTEEKLGTTERTEYDLHFQNLAERADVTKTWTEKIVRDTESVLIPNPQNRVEDFIFEKIEKSKPKRLSNLEHLALDMIEAGGDFGQDLPYGQALIKAGQAEQKLGQCEHDFIATSGICFTQPLRKFLEGEMKTIGKERGILETKRLDLDACKNRVKKARSMLGQQSVSKSVVGFWGGIDFVMAFLLTVFFCPLLLGLYRKMASRQRPSWNRYRNLDRALDSCLINMRITNSNCFPRRSATCGWPRPSLTGNRRSPSCCWTGSAPPRPRTCATCTPSSRRRCATTSSAAMSWSSCSVSWPSKLMVMTIEDGCVSDSQIGTIRIRPCTTNNQAPSLMYPVCSLLVISLCVMLSVCGLTECSTPSHACASIAKTLMVGLPALCRCIPVIPIP